MTDVPTSASALVHRFEVEIASGQRRPGERLPTVRELAVESGLAPATVASAYKQLRSRGLVIGRGRQGTTVAPLAHVPPPAPTAVDGLIDAASGTPDPALLPDLGAALAAAARHPQASYGDPLLVPELEEAARAHFARDAIDATYLTVTNGSMDAIDRVLRAQGFRAGDRIGVEDPGHVPVHQVVRSAGLTPVPLPIDHEGITVDGLRTVAERLTAVIVTPRSQNPTGAAFGPERAADLSTVLDQHPSIVVIHDDHAGDIAGTPYEPLRSGSRRWATVRSLGKSFGPDLRIALLAGDAVTIDRVAASVATGPGWVSTLLQRAAAHLLTDPAALTTVRRAARTYGRRRADFIAALSGYGLDGSARSGLNVWLPTPDEGRAVAAALEAGFAIRPGADWRINSRSAVRITISRLDDESIASLAEAVGSRFTSSGRSTTV